MLLRKENRNKESKQYKDSYTPSEIIEKSGKLSGDWLEKDIRKSFPDLTRKGKEKKEKKDQ